MGRILTSRTHCKLPSPRPGGNIITRMGHGYDLGFKDGITSEGHSVEMLTLRSWGSFPARASRSVVFPELGGPRSSVILGNTD